jgi:sulfatase modifying factor 1
VLHTRSACTTALVVLAATGCTGKVSVLEDDVDSAATTVTEPLDTSDTGGEVNEPDPDPYTTWLHTVDLAGGTFDMGCTRPTEWPCTDDERPSRTITLSPFTILQTEVPRGMYRSLTGNAERPAGCTQDDCALVGVSWLDAVAFCNLVSEAEGLVPAYSISGSTVTTNEAATGWRLPTEAEWEYAARGNRDLLYAGSSDLEQVAWTSDNSGGRPHEVGEKSPNDFDLFDMSGNVAEWVFDRFGTYQTDVGADPTGPATGSARVLRGGSWTDGADHARVSARTSAAPDHKSDTIGFRMVRPTP